MSQQHSAHTQIATTVRSWFHDPFDDMGYRAERRTWGTYWNTGRVYVSTLSVEQVPAFLDDLRRYYDQQSSVSIALDDPILETNLAPALRDAGTRPGDTVVFLAHVGLIPPVRAVPGLTVEWVDETNVRAFADTRLRAFGNSEWAPATGHIEREIERRLAELGGIGRGRLARLDGEPAAVLWWQEEERDRWVNSLGTRLPFRRRGIAAYLLRQCLVDAYHRGRRSIVLNVKTDNRPALQLYRRLGFQDEVYRRTIYRFTWRSVS